MRVKSLFSLILKVLGIFFIKDIFISIPTIIAAFYSFFNNDFSDGLYMLFFSLATIFIHLLIIYYLIFRTDYIIDKLKLEDRFPEDPIPLNLHRSTVISITVGVVAVLLITQAIPLLIRELASWYQYSRATRGVLNMGNNFEYSSLLVYIAEIIIGFLLLGHLPSITNFIELKQRSKNGG